MALESVQWVLTLLNSVNDLAAMLGKTHAALPEEFRQKLPKLFGLTLDDERIFWGVVASIDDPQKRIAIGDFLATCKDFERNRFVNIVAGMEITPGKPAESEEKFDPKTGNQTYKKTKAGSVGLDLRKRFLESFADDIIKQNFRNMDEAYEYCVSGRMILPNPLHQKALKAFSNSTKEFKKGAISIQDLAVKVKETAVKVAAKSKKKTSVIVTEGVTKVEKEGRTFSENFRLLEQASIDFRDAKKKGGKK